ERRGDGEHRPRFRPESARSMRCLFEFSSVVLRAAHACVRPLADNQQCKRAKEGVMRERPVLLATNTFGLLDGEINGVAYTCRNLVEMFRAADIAVDVLTYGRPERIETDGSVRLLVHDPKNGINIDPSLRIDPFFALGRISREIAATRYSIVHSTTPDPL